MRTNPVIRVISTGGTIDKVYDELKQENMFQGETAIPNMLRDAFNTTVTTVESIMHKDSLHMKTDDRMLIAEVCSEATEDMLVITHGTDTILETAAIIAKRNLPKTIVMTGALRPYSFGNSDALANLGGSLIGVQLAPHGVYVCISGLLLPWDNARRNREHGWFESLHDEDAE